MYIVVALPCWPLDLAFGTHGSLSLSLSLKIAMKDTLILLFYDRIIIPSLLLIIVRLLTFEKLSPSRAVKTNKKIIHPHPLKIQKEDILSAQQ